MKKIIVEISDEHFETLVAMRDIGLGYYQNAILNGKPLEDELNEIKTEIIEYKQKYLDVYPVVVGITVGIDVLNKRIKELNDESDK